ncbi:uncharacterized protein [Equus przewalskii]|uniref:Uncharacterized protein n=1 Tax=Equus przewalskii TaxID=9798 RepID=A0ABM4M308_EQUPR
MDSRKEEEKKGIKVRNKPILLKAFDHLVESLKGKSVNFSGFSVLHFTVSEAASLAKKALHRSSLKAAIGLRSAANVPRQDWKSQPLSVSQSEQQNSGGKAECNPWFCTLGTKKLARTLLRQDCFGEEMRGSWDLFQRKLINSEHLQLKLPLDIVGSVACIIPLTEQS